MVVIHELATSLGSILPRSVSTLHRSVISARSGATINQTDREQHSGGRRGEGGGREADSRNGDILTHRPSQSVLPVLRRASL